jgi:hypothetical protein
MSYWGEAFPIKRALFALLLFTLQVGHAVAICIPAGDTQTFVNAIHDAATSDAASTIKLEQGTYLRQDDIEELDMSSDLSILGGYVPTPNHTCSARTIDASNTQILIDGAFILEIYGALTKVEGVTFGSQSVGHGVRLWGNNIVLDHVRVTNQQSMFSMILGDWSNSSVDFKLTDVQLDHLEPLVTTCSVQATLSGHARASLNHVTIDLSSGDFCLNAGGHDGNKVIDIRNSIIWDWDPTNSGGVIITDHEDDDDPIRIVMHAVDFADVSISPSDSLVLDPDSPSFQLDPMWTDPAGGDFSLSGGPNSPVINTGTANVPDGEPPTDILGVDRGIGSAPDLGAFESLYDDFTGNNTFIVTNGNDVADPASPLYPGSLRWAFDKANAGSARSLIQFNLPSCPAAIVLNSPLPDVWVPLTIDGYSMSGASVNTDTRLSNATLCVIVRPTTPLALPVGLRVPSGATGASLTVQGLWLGGFARGIELLGGFNHQIIGNQFGLTSGFSFFGFSSAGVRVETSSPVIIGGSNPSERNVFLYALSSDNSNAAGVLIGYGTSAAEGACQIVGNLFGIWPDGTDANGNNENGILIQGNGCAVLGNYLAGDTKDAIRLMGGSHNVIQNNIIGSAPTFGQDFSNPGAGIRITNGANDNIIGAGEGFYGPVYSYQNTITDMDAGGVIVSNSTGNTINGNAIFGNGLSSGLNLDLGGDGPTPNDPGDADGGPNAANDFMNYPAPYGITWTTGGTPQPGSVELSVGGYLDVPPGNYLIDAYYDLGCSPTGRGGGTWVGEQLYSGLFPGAGAFSIPVYIPIFNFDSANGRLSLTVTARDGHQSTSEFSQCLSVDTIFEDGFER